MRLSLLLAVLMTFPAVAQQLPVSDQLCQDAVPGGFGNLRRCNELRVFSGFTLPTSLDGVDGSVYLYFGGTAPGISLCIMGPKKAGIWPSGCMNSTAALPLVQCSTITQPPPGQTVLVVTNAPVGTSGALIGQAQCLAGFRVVTLDGATPTPIALRAPDLTRQLEAVLNTGLAGMPVYAHWGTATLKP